MKNELKVYRSKHLCPHPHPLSYPPLLQAHFHSSPLFYVVLSLLVPHYAINEPSLPVVHAQPQWRVSLGTHGITIKYFDNLLEGLQGNATVSFG